MASVAAFQIVPTARSATLRLRTGLRIASAAGLLSVLLAPVLPASQGQSGRAVANIAFTLIRPSVPAELQPASSTSGFVIPSAAPFIASYSDPASGLRAETCLTEAIYYEGAMEPEAGQRAIAQVVLNRVRHPAYPNNVCGVVYQGQERSTGCQFTFTCDGSRARTPVPKLWARANRIAREALAGAVAPQVGLSTHYHADYVTPYWSATLDQSGQIGRHIFYRWRGGTGQPQAFTTQYAGREPMIAAWVPRTTPAADPGKAVTGIDASLGAAPLPNIPESPPAPRPFRARPLPLATATPGGTP